MDTLLKRIPIPSEQRKRTTIAKNLSYDLLEIYDNKVIGYHNGQKTMTWFFKSYISIDIVKANLNSQFAQVIFLTGFNSNNRVVGLDFFSKQNQIAMNDTNRILFCSGMFSFSKTNDFAEMVSMEIRNAFDNYKNNEDSFTDFIADEMLKLKNLFDNGIITQEEFEAKKKQILKL